MWHITQKKQSEGIENEIAQMLDLADKNFRTNWKLFKELKDNILRGWKEYMVLKREQRRNFTDKWKL